MIKKIKKSRKISNKTKAVDYKLFALHRDSVDKGYKIVLQ